MADLTIKQVKEKKIELEEAITKLMKDFEKETGTRLGYVSIERKRDKKEKQAMPESFNPKKREIVTVEVNMDIDLV
jgi:hypothetical protein